MTLLVRSRTMTNWLSIYSQIKERTLEREEMQTAEGKKCAISQLQDSVYLDNVKTEILLH
jgi:hypothetical protein